MITAVQFYDVTVFFHILAVVLVFGPTYLYGPLFATAGQTNPAAVPTIGRVVVLWGSTAGRIGMLVILASGLYLTDDRWDFSDFFASWGLAAIIALFALSEAFFLPSTRRLVDAAEAGRVDEVQAIAARQRVVGPIAGLIVILTLYVMSAKPFL
jgi:hypothetical protein